MHVFVIKIGTCIYMYKACRIPVFHIKFGRGKGKYKKAIVLEHGMACKTCFIRKSLSCDVYSKNL